MKRLAAFLVAFLLSPVVGAQSTPPMRMQSNGTFLPLRYRLNCTGLTCADNPSNASIDISGISSTGFPLFAPDGAVGAPSYSFVNGNSTGLWRPGAGQLELSVDSSNFFKAQSASMQIGAAGNTIIYTGADLSPNAAGGVTIGATQPVGSINSNSTVRGTALALVAGSSFAFSNAPTISSGFGTSPSVTINNGTPTFRINVGTGGVATSGTISLPIAPGGQWNCFCNDITTISTTVFMCRQTGGTNNTATIGNFNTSGSASAWTASDVLLVQCLAD